MAYSSRRRQRGLALLLAMLIVVIATTVAVSILHAEKFTLRKNGHIQLMDRAGLYAVGLEDWAMNIPGLPIEGGFLSGYIEDEQAKFNLNSIVISEVALTRFQRLCDNLEVDRGFIPALMDWIDEDFDIRYPDGMEENYDAYRVANRELADVSELMLVHNVTAEMVEKLRPYVTALPATTTINVNTMSETVFLSLGESLDAARFIEERESDPFDSVEEFIERLQLPIESEGLSVGTRYFRAHGQVVQGDRSFNLTSLVFRDEKGATAVVNRTLGQF